jgi:hypothetical protein
MALVVFQRAKSLHMPPITKVAVAAGSQVGGQTYYNVTVGAIVKRVDEREFSQVLFPSPFT